MRALPYLIPVALAIYALIDLSRSVPEERSGLRRWVWALIVVLLPVLGPVAWLVVSRLNRREGDARRATATGSTPSARGPQRPWTPPRRPGPVAPDDDPDFLWRLEAEQRRRRQGGRTPGSAGPAHPSPPAPPTTTPDDADGTPGKEAGGESGTEPRRG